MMPEISFEKLPWELYLEQLKPGEMADALTLLSLTEEDSPEAALDALEELGIGLDISALGDLPAGEETAVRLRRERELAGKGTLLKDLSENDPLRLCLEEIAAIPTAGDPQLLAEEYAAGNEAVQPRLVNAALSLVIESAKALAGRGILLLDLIQEGSLGLWQGILRFEKGDFVSHCQKWIDFYMAKAMVLYAREAGVGGKMRRGMQDYLDADQKLLGELGRNPTIQEIADALHITPGEAYAYEAMVNAARMKSRVEEQREEKEESPEDNMAVEDTAYFQSRQRISEMLSRLAPREAELLTLRFGLEGGQPATPEEIGKKWKMTPEEVLQAEAAALAKLRDDT